MKLTYTSNSKLVMLSCATYKSCTIDGENDWGNKNFMNAISSLFENDNWLHNKKDFFIEKLDGEDNYNYKESCAGPCSTNFKVIDVYQNMRDFHFYRFFDFEVIKSSEVQKEFWSVNGITSNIVFDRAGVFLLVTEIDLDINENRLFEALSEIYDEKNIAKNIGIYFEINDLFRKSEKRINNFFHSVDPTRNVDVHFDIAFTHPIFMTSLESAPNLYSFFKNEEMEFEQDRGLSTSYRNAFFHAGWNYSIACNLSREAFSKVIEFISVCQSQYFMLEYYKKFFSTEFSSAFKRRNDLNRKDILSADLVSAVFYDLRAKTNAFRSKLFPKYKGEMDGLLNRWNCNEDIRIVEGNISSINELKNNFHQTKVEEQNSRQNMALTFIGLFQILTLFGAVATIFDLGAKDKYVLILAVGFVAASYLYFGAKSDFKKISHVFALLSLSFCAIVLWAKF